MSDGRPPQFKRMTSDEFNAAREACNLTQGDFCRLTGSSRKKVMEWSEGTEDIPVWVPVLFAAMIDGGFDAAWKEADARIIMA